MTRNPFIVALDTHDLATANRLARSLRDHVGGFKVGLELFTAHGPAAVAAVRDHAPVFLDLKLHDIPTTVGRTAERCAALGASMLTVHAAGGETMVRAAVDGFGDGLVLGVTVLTSLNDDDLAILQLGAIDEFVPHLAKLAVTAGAGGIVCAPTDLRRVSDAVGDAAVLVTPGVRLAGDSRDDHSRAASPAAALAGGADWLVVGRPVTGADDPIAAIEAFLVDAGVA